MSVILEITREAIDFCLKVCQCAKTALVTHIKPNLLISYFAADDKLQSGDLWDGLLLKSKHEENKKTTSSLQVPQIACLCPFVFPPHALSSHRSRWANTVGFVGSAARVFLAVSSGT